MTHFTVPFLGAVRFGCTSFYYLHFFSGHALVVTGDVLEHCSREGGVKVLCDGKTVTQPPVNNNVSYPRIPPVYERGLASLLHHLADKLTTGDLSGSNLSSGGDDDNSDRIAGFDDALYVHAVIEAVRWSSKNKAWAKVTTLSVPSDDVMLLDGSSQQS